MSLNGNYDAYMALVIANKTCIYCTILISR